jgi:hypothetical protein
LSGRNSAVECQLPKLDVAGSTPVARSKFFKGSHLLVWAFLFSGNSGSMSEKDFQGIFPFLLEN